MSGLDIPLATIDALRRCEVDVWLIPKDAKPFDGPNKCPTMGFAPCFRNRSHAHSSTRTNPTRARSMCGDAAHHGIPNDTCPPRHGAPPSQYIARSATIPGGASVPVFSTVNSAAKLWFCSDGIDDGSIV
jgi:hypothetical protein